MKTAEEVADEFKHYAYSVSHDVGAPVRAMVQFSRILSEECSTQLDEQGREYLQHIVESGQKLQRMMNSLLTYSRLMTRDPHYTSINVAHVVSCCLDELNDLAERNNATLCVSDLPNIYGDMAQIYQIFYVLIDNAIRYCLPGNPPKVHIYAMPAGDFWQFHVVDNGVGIPEDFHHKVFMPFAKLHADEAGAGIGMGLTIAHKIAELHGGSLNHSPADSRGTDFYVLLPARRIKA
jgi:light-regulated signal transduction histidine kinase (bacteriophytochrome)